MEWRERSCLFVSFWRFEYLRSKKWREAHTGVPGEPPHDGLNSRFRDVLIGIRRLCRHRRRQSPLLRHLRRTRSLRGLQTAGSYLTLPHLGSLRPSVGRATPAWLSVSHHLATQSTRLGLMTTSARYRSVLQSSRRFFHNLFLSPMGSS